MANHGSGMETDPPKWPDGDNALRLYRFEDPTDAAPTSLILSHPTAPNIAPAVAELTETKLQDIAYRYLLAAQQHFGKIGNPDFDLPKHWLGALDPAQPPDPRFGWLPISPPKDGGKYRDPLLSSYWVKRTKGEVTQDPDPEHGWPECSEGVDCTLILMASEKEGHEFTGSQFGLRVVLHVTRDPNELYVARTTGMSASLPFGPFVMEEAAAGSAGFDDMESLWKFLLDSKSHVARTLQLDEGSIFYRGVRRVKSPNETGIQYELRGTGTPDKTKETFESLPYGFVVLVASNDSGDTVQQQAKYPLVSDAAPGTARVFPRDPASSRLTIDGPRLRRTTRTGAQLDAHREEKRICAAPNCVLENFDAKVNISRFVREDHPRLPPSGAKTVPLPGNQFPPVRSNDFSAVSAFDKANELFRSMRRYGIAPGDYFRVGRLPLQLYYRSGVRPGRGKDGQTTNARVVAKEWGKDFFALSQPDERPLIELHLALGNLSHRARTRWGTEPLGIATDGRWMWHEFGHVLLMAAFGDLEFHFAHSPGDALAAVMADPRSRLADRSLSSSVENWRGVTFPWVFLTRRHDRCVLNGWSWSGTMHRAVAGLPNHDGGTLKAYRAEQILSTTLFRLYRCLGGDSTAIVNGQEVADGDARELASHYTIFLIMKALQLLGCPPTRAETFADALVQADIATVTPFSVPLESGNTGTRIGGCAHKVVRWAFEAQGMYTLDPQVIVNAPGEPEDVDIYIDDGRPDSERTQAGDVVFATKGYVSVSVDWRNVPAWHANDNAIKVESEGFFVIVRNRGRLAAQNVMVRVWWKPMPANPSGEQWDAGAGWTHCNLQAVQNVPPSGAVEFGPFDPLPPTPGDYLVFAQASCADDRANSDPASGLPCSSQATPLVDLVAGDNNIGLRVIKIGPVPL